MTHSDTIDFDPKELARRRRLADARRGRESERRSLLIKLIRTGQRAEHLRNLINIYEGPQATKSCPAIQRMLEWARAQLGELEAFVGPVRLSATLLDRNLFPDVDELADPLGEPPPRQLWGR
jgi:hypothetical protein